jgi:hypothetical protein
MREALFVRQQLGRVEPIEPRLHNRELLVRNGPQKTAFWVSFPGAQ